MLRLRTLLVSASVLSLILAGCGSDDEATPTQTIEVTTTTEAIQSGDYNQESLEAALLAPADVGEGYSSNGAGPSEDGPTGCAALDSISDRLNEATLKSEILLSNETSGDLVNQIISIDENADADFTAFTEAIGACASFAIDLQGQTVTFTSVPIEVPTVGDQSNGGRFTTTILGVSASVDYVVFRKGDALSAILATSYDNTDAGRIGNLGAKAADKLF